MLAKYAYFLNTFNLLEAKQSILELLDLDLNNKADFFIFLNYIETLEKDFEKRLREFYISAKIKIHQKAYSEFLLKIFAVSENILKPELESLLGGKIVYDSQNKHKEWNELIQKNQELVAHLKTCIMDGNENNKLNFSYPNRAAFLEIYSYFVDKNPSEANQQKYELIKILELLTRLRNKVAHELAGVSRNSIDEYLKKESNQKYDLSVFLEKADTYFDAKDFSIYDKINQKIISLL